MQMSTNTRILKDGHPFAATTSAPRANGRAKIVCEKRINRRNRDTDPPPVIGSACRSFRFTNATIQRRRPYLDRVYSCAFVVNRTSVAQRAFTFPDLPENVCSSDAPGHAWFVLFRSLRLRRSTRRTLRDFSVRGTCKQ